MHHKPVQHRSGQMLQQPLLFAGTKLLTLHAVAWRNDRRCNILRTLRRWGCCQLAAHTVHTMMITMYHLKLFASRSCYLRHSQSLVQDLSKLSFQVRSLKISIPSSWYDTSNHTYTNRYILQGFASLEVMILARFDGDISLITILRWSQQII